MNEWTVGQNEGTWGRREGEEGGRRGAEKNTRAGRVIFLTFYLYTESQESLKRAKNRHDLREREGPESHSTHFAPMDQALRTRSRRIYPPGREYYEVVRGRNNKKKKTR